MSEKGEEGEVSARRSWCRALASKLLLRIKLWFNRADLPDVESPDYSELGSMDVFTTELLIINTRQNKIATYIQLSRNY